MVARIRYFVLGIVVVLALVVVVHATTWVFWVGAPNANSPSNATSATWGNYWNAGTFIYSTQSVTWIIPYYNQFLSIPYYYTNPLGLSGNGTWVALSSAYTLNNYVYQGTVGAYSNVGIGSNYTFSSGYQYFVAVAWYHPSSETCGQLYFHADVYNNSTSTAMFYGTYIIANGTWSYVTFFSGTASSNTWFNPAVPGPNTCLSSGGYYVYIATIAVNVSEYTVGTAQVGIGTTSEGTSYTPGTQYAWGNTPSSGDTIVVPWTTYANPYIITIVQQVVNTAGSSASGYFYITTPIEWYYPGSNFVWSNINPSVEMNAYYFVYAYDNDTGYFPQSTITAVNCPSGVYMLPATISSSVTKILTCSGISSPSSGIAIYPTDYGKYSSSPATYSPPTGYVVTFSYTDSAGNTYSLPDYFTVPTTVYLYITSGSYSITTEQVSFSLQTNMTFFSIQPTSTTVFNQFKAGYESAGYLLQMPVCTISSNPYSGGGYTGATGTFGLFNCVAIKYGAISAVVWFYEPNNGQGTLISFQYSPYPSANVPYTPWLYVGTDGKLYAGDVSNSMHQIVSALTPGWHMAVIEEWALSTSGPYYIALYLDGQFVGSVTMSSLPQLFGRNGIYPYNYIGTGFTQHWSNVNGEWFFFNGTIAYVAIYNTVLNSSQVQQLYSAGFPNTLFSNNLVVAYLLTNTTYYVFDGVSHFYIKPYFANSQILSQLGITNASLVTITPLGQVGWVPFSQWVPVPSQPISYCRLLWVYGLNVVGGNSTVVTYQVVVGTKAPMSNFPLDYLLLLRYTYFAAGATETKYMLVHIHAFGYGEVYKALITVKKKPFASISILFPTCNLPPGSVSINQNLVTTNVSSLIKLSVTFMVSNPPQTSTAFPGVVYLNNTPYYTFSVIVPPGAYGATTTTIRFNAPSDPGTYIGNVTVFGLSTPIELVVEAPPSVNTTNSTSPPSLGTNSTSNTPPPNTSGSLSSSSSSTSTSSASSSTSTASTILTKLSASLANALTTVTTYLANPVVIALLVLAIVAIAYVIYKRLTEVVIKL